jgi:hypothetical protein
MLPLPHLPNEQRGGFALALELALLDYDVPNRANIKALQQQLNTKIALSPHFTFDEIVGYNLGVGYVNAIAKTTVLKPATTMTSLLRGH